jgi:hypothetical protein
VSVAPERLLRLRRATERGRTNGFPQQTKESSGEQSRITSNVAGPTRQRSRGRAILAFCGPLVDAETGTTSWFAFKVAPATFGIFDTFADEDGRSAHVNGEIAKALFGRAEELFVAPPDVKPVDIITERL